MTKLLFLFLLPLFVFGQGQQRFANGTATDQDGNSFEWINYGTQIWAIENAEVVTYRDGTEIPQVKDATEWSNLTTGAWCFYSNDPSKGKLYNWYAVMGIHDNDENTPNKAFAPEGWHVPSHDELRIFKKFLISNSYNFDREKKRNKIAKSMASTTGWITTKKSGFPGNDQKTNNNSGFSAFPAGIRGYKGSFGSDGNLATYWTFFSTDSNFSQLYCLNNYDFSLHIQRYRNKKTKRLGASVRFVKD